VTAALTRGDLKSTMDAIAVGRQNTILSGDEGRELLELNKLSGGQGEVMLIPSGSQPLMGDGTPVEPTAPSVTDEPKPIAKGSEAVN
jgi:hypothetical protein